MIFATLKITHFLQVVRLKVKKLQFPVMFYPLQHLSQCIYIIVTNVNDPCFCNFFCLYFIGKNLKVVYNYM